MTAQQIIESYWAEVTAKKQKKQIVFFYSNCSLQAAKGNI